MNIDIFSFNLPNSTCDEEGILRVKKLHCKNRTFFMRRFRTVNFSIPVSDHFKLEYLKNCFVIEDIVIDRSKNQFSSKSYNLNYLDYGRIVEEYNVYPHLKFK